MLLDVRLPKMNGLEVLKHVKEQHSPGRGDRHLRGQRSGDGGAGDQAGRVSLHHEGFRSDALRPHGERRARNWSSRTPDLRRARRAQQRSRSEFSAERGDAAVMGLVRKVAEALATVLRARRERHRQGAARAAAAPASPRANGAVRRGQLRGDPAELLESSFSATRPARSRGASSQVGQFELADRAARCSSTRSATCAGHAGEAPARPPGAIERVGGAKRVPAAISALVTTTNRDLERAVRDGPFREDLFFRINVIHSAAAAARADRRRPPAPRSCSSARARASTSGDGHRRR